MPFTNGAPAQPAAPSIHWRLVWGVMAMQVCLHLGWIVYNAYQPLLLNNFGFAGLLPTFALLPGFLGLLIEPISGAVTDRWAPQARGRLLPITISVTVAGLIFLATAGLLQRGPTWIAHALPGLMVVWMVSVQSASSPNLAQLNEAVSLRSLPQAVALLTFSQGLIGAFSGELAQGALRLGPSLTFVLGGLVLAVGLAVLRAAQASPRYGSSSGLAPGQESSTTASPSGSELPAGLLRTSLLLGLALAVGVQTQILLDLLPRLAAPTPPGLMAGGQGSVLLLFSALGAPLTARAVGRWGRLRCLAAGILVLAMAVAASLVVPHALRPLRQPLLGVIHSLVVTSLTASSLASLPPRWSGLGAGLALGGTGLAASLVRLRFGSAGPVLPQTLLSLLAVTTVAALVGCLLLERLRRRA